jgi:pimeloyl-ACP methyl ester carboxylesterase
LEKKNNQNFLPAYKIFVNSDKLQINYSNFKMPTLIMTGENEVGSTPLMSERINKEIKNSNLYIIKNAKHGATIEQANVVNEQLNKFLF